MFFSIRGSNCGGSIIGGRTGLLKWCQCAPSEKSAGAKYFKMVFDIKDQWIIVDVNELHNYLEENKLKKVQLEDLISNLEWNIVLPK